MKGWTLIISLKQNCGRYKSDKFLSVNYFQLSCSMQKIKIINSCVMKE